jgi:hypothetical protein
MTGLPNADLALASRTRERRVILRYGVNAAGAGEAAEKVSVNFVGDMLVGSSGRNETNGRMTREWACCWLLTGRSHYRSRFRIRPRGGSR